MNQTKLFQETLFHEMEVAVRTIKGLLEKVEESQWEYKPANNMRTLKELAQHLVAIPRTDLAILKESSEEEVHRLNNEIEGLNGYRELSDELEAGLSLLKDYMGNLDDETFLTKKTKAFYAEEGATQIQWLTEILTHMFHHRAQLFNYLKQLGQPVNMFDLY
ncbi:DinB family protein [Pseudalkalibacillus caeni]|uniref:DinB family protein n=1 Tax=Exobacillus caeni TaxID=2574798 RepID=A0A5R9F3F5_9BACL|nr:DinB family protein [Pseudalkalibacillus caeni]TLS36118.1 DinB family protein [Pseudalkalibacillus caeni]